LPEGDEGTRTIPCQGNDRPGLKGGRKRTIEKIGEAGEVLIPVLRKEREHIPSFVRKEGDPDRGKWERRGEEMLAEWKKQLVPTLVPQGEGFHALPGEGESRNPEGEKKGDSLSRKAKEEKGLLGGKKERNSQKGSPSTSSQGGEKKEDGGRAAFKKRGGVPPGNSKRKGALTRASGGGGLPGRKRKEIEDANLTGGTKKN